MPSIDSVQARSFGGEDNFASRGLAGWQAFHWPTLALVWLTGYPLARLAVRPWPAVALLAAVTAATLVGLFLRALGRAE